MPKLPEWPPPHWDDKPTLGPPGPPPTTRSSNAALSAEQEREYQMWLAVRGQPATRAAWLGVRGDQPAPSIALTPFQIRAMRQPEPPEPSHVRDTVGSVPAGMPTPSRMPVPVPIPMPARYAAPVPPVLGVASSYDFAADPPTGAGPRSDEGGE
jgi:hypothetical protein